MSSTATVPREKDTFGGLLRDKETPEQALRRLERSPIYTSIIASDEGQRLLEAATAQIETQPNGGLPMETPQVHPKRKRGQGSLEALAETAALEGEADPLLEIVPNAEVHSPDDGHVHVTDDDGSIVAVLEQGDVVERAVAAIPDEPASEILICVGNNHVPGCAHFPREAKARSKTKIIAEAPATEPIHKPNPTDGIRLMDLDLSLVDVGENVRIDPGELEELVASISDVGVLQPIKAIGPGPDGRYRAVWGQRRILASRLADKDTIPAIVEAAADVDAPGARRSIEQLAENLIRKDLNPIEEAEALRAILDADPELTQVDLAARLGRSGPWISNALRLLGLEDTAKEAVRSGKLSGSHGRALANLQPKVQASLAAEAVEGKRSTRDLEQSIKWRTDEQAAKDATAKRTEKWIPKLIEALADTPAGTKIYVGVNSYQFDTDAIVKAIRGAGWATTNEYAQHRPAAGKCDCKVVRVEFNRKWTVEPGCLDHRHADRQRNVQKVEDDTARKANVEREKLLLEALLPALEAIPTPILILAHGDTWQTPGLVKAVQTGELTEDQLRAKVAAAMVDRVRASTTWNDRIGAVQAALEGLLAMFAIQLTLDNAGE